MRTPLRKDEKVILVIRPHWLQLTWPVLLAVASVFAGILIRGYGFVISFAFICYAGFKIMQRNKNVWAVTNLRVIDEDGVFSNNSKESPLDKINNVTYSQTLMGRILGYGNVQIQTAAEIGATTYYNVEKPRKLKDTITLMQEEYKKSRDYNQAQELAKAIVTESGNTRGKSAADEVEKLYDLKQKGILTEEEFNSGKKKILES